MSRSKVLPDSISMPLVLFALPDLAQIGNDRCRAERLPSTDVVAINVRLDSGINYSVALVIF